MIKRKGMYLYSGMLLMFLLIGWNVMLQTNGLEKIDEVGSQWIQSDISPQLTIFYEKISALSSPTVNLVLAAIVFLILFFMRHRVKAFFFFSSFLISGAIIPYVIKHIIGRARPVYQLLPETGYSFPSGHVASGVTLYLLILWLIFQNQKKNSLKLIAVIFIIGWIGLVGVSRVYLGAHYLSDVTASLLLCSALTGILLHYHKPIEDIIRL